ncbi:MAG: CDP-alcohol phosphatidyltransferase family protein [Verrucomicrobiota bacterium]
MRNSRIENQKSIPTPATFVTIGRIVLVPVFIWIAVEFSRSLAAGEPNQSLRTVACWIFAIAWISDGVDGFMARHFGQRSWLGEILDPLADKILVGVSIIAFSLAPWELPIPLWFAVFVIGRDIIQLISLSVLSALIGKVEMVALWTGKWATIAQMVALSWIMLRLPELGLQAILWAGAVLTFTSGFQYLLSAISQHNEFQRNRTSGNP